jgi:hypothetical protein
MKSLLIILFYSMLLIISRLMPHPPNFGPAIVIALMLGRELKWSLGLLSLLFSFVISDGFLTMLQGYTWFGSWTVFTYSALILILVLSKFSQEFNIVVAMFATGFYWMWTNFGVWLLSGMYTHNFNGILECYIAALPFLNYSLLGTIVWYYVLMNTATKKVLNLT